MERAAARTAADMRCRGDDDEGDGVPGLKVEVASAMTALPHRRLSGCTGGVSQLAMTTATSDFACYYCVSAFGQRHQPLEHNCRTLLRHIIRSHTGPSKLHLNSSRSYEMPSSVLRRQIASSVEFAHKAYLQPSPAKYAFSLHVV